MPSGISDSLAQKCGFFQDESESCFTSSHFDNDTISIQIGTIQKSETFACDHFNRNEVDLKSFSIAMHWRCYIVSNFFFEKWVFLSCKFSWGTSALQ